MVLSIPQILALADAIRVMLEATASIATQLRALVMDVLRMMELAFVSRIGGGTIVRN